MSFQNFDDFKSYTLATSKRTFEARGRHIPLFLVDRDDAPMMMIPAPWSNDQEKEAYTCFVKLLCAELNAPRVALVTEAWMADDKQGLRAMDCPDRREVLWVICQSKTDAAMAGFYPIVRSATGVALDPFVPIEDSTTIFDNILNQSTVQ